MLNKKFFLRECPHLESILDGHDLSLTTYPYATKAALISNKNWSCFYNPKQN